VAAVEFAVLMPFIFMLVVGVWELGRMIHVQQALVNAAREAGRQAASAQFTNTQCQTVAIQYLAEAGLPTTNATATVGDITNPSQDATTAQYLDQLQVVVTLPYKDVRWSVSSYFVSPTTILQAKVTWVTMLDQAYPTDPEPPQG